MNNTLESQEGQFCNSVKSYVTLSLQLSKTTEAGLLPSSYSKTAVEVDLTCIKYFLPELASYNFKHRYHSDASITYEDFPKKNLHFKKPASHCGAFLETTGWIRGWHLDHMGIQKHTETP